MKIAVTGSIATDHLMHFPGRFADQLLADQLHKVSLSFLVDDLVVRRGGVAPNIAFGMAQLGPAARCCVGAVGADFADYRSWLERHGVDCDSVHVSEVAHTARFVCTTDTRPEPDRLVLRRRDERGPQHRARAGRRAGRRPRPGAGQRQRPEAMVRHSEECREPRVRVRRRPVAAAGPHGRRRHRQADRRRRVPAHQRLREVAAGEQGRADRRAGARPGAGAGHHARASTASRSPAATSSRSTCRCARRGPAVDPTGVGDGFRAGFFAALSWGLGLERAAQVGSLLATLVLETVGTQEYDVRADGFVKRLGEAYGDEAAEDVRPHLAG